MTATEQVTQRHLFHASPTQVWEAWTQPSLLAQWFITLGMIPMSVEAEVTIGGTYRVEWRPDASAPPAPAEFGDTLVATGQFLQVDPLVALTFTWHWEGWSEESRVSIKLTQMGNETELVLIHDLLSTQASRKFHGDGWIPALENLGRVLSDL